MAERRRQRKRDRNRTGHPSELSLGEPESTGPSASTQTTQPPRQDATEWQWRTFPVGFAFALGALIMGLLVWVAPGSFYVFLIGAFFLTVFGIAHYFGRSFREYRAGDDDG